MLRLVQKFMRSILAICILIGAGLSAQSVVAISQAEAAEHASVIMYHRFGVSDMPSTNISIDQFEAHLEELANGPYNVLPLSEITEAIIEGRPLRLFQSIKRRFRGLRTMDFRLLCLSQPTRLTVI